jgi:hypothetical protein
VIAWDPETGEFQRVEGPNGFTAWEEADERADSSWEAPRARSVTGVLQ